MDATTSESITTMEAVTSPPVYNEQDFENECGTCDPSLDPRIVGGSEARIGQFPWIARLGYVEGGNRRFAGDHALALEVRLIDTDSRAQPYSNNKEARVTFTADIQL